MLLKFLFARRREIAVFALFTLIFAAVFFLFRLPVMTVLYAALICAVAGLIIGAFDYIAFLKRHRELSALIRAPMTLLDMPLAGRDTIEQDYIDLVGRIYGEALALMERSSEEKTELADYFTLWAHQIKTPIAAMRLILQSEDSPVSREMEAQLFLTERYVSMALAYMHMNGEGTDYLIKKYRLADVVRQALRNYAPLFIRSKVRIKLGALEADVLTDEKWLCFAVEQVLSNAIKYSPDGTVEIFLEDGPTLVISDDGAGIAAQDLPRMFERGFTGYNGRADKRATGVGLYLTKKILTSLGHSISIASERGRGTRVAICLRTDATLYD